MTIRKLNYLIDVRYKRLATLSRRIGRNNSFHKDIAEAFTDNAESETQLLERLIRIEREANPKLWTLIQ